MAVKKGPERKTGRAGKAEGQGGTVTKPARDVAPEQSLLVGGLLDNRTPAVISRERRRPAVSAAGAEQTGFPRVVRVLIPPARPARRRPVARPSSPRGDPSPLSKIDLVFPQQRRQPVRVVRRDAGHAPFEQ